MPRYIFVRINRWWDPDIAKKRKQFLLPLLLAIGLVFSGCSGTGIKDYTSIDELATGGIAELSSSNGQAFVYRPVHNYAGGGIMMEIVMNGHQIGKLGAGEFVSENMQPGQNNMIMRMKGLFGQKQSQPLRFVSNSNKNLFFVAYQDFGLIGSELVLREVSEQEWRTFLSR